MSLPGQSLFRFRSTDTEFYNTLGLDIYSCQFDKKAGIGLFRSRNLEVLVIKLEISDEKKEDAIQSFASIPQFSLQKYNTAESKSRYKGNYKEFIHSIKISTEYIEAMYNSKFSRHFYSDMELQALRNKWLPE